MQVSHVNEFVTHAVIGGKESIEFSISNSAEFFNILSSTLYKDQILAVVREVLCNAWDAHIEAGCTDRPVQLTLSSDKFTIKDFGKGIHHDDMGLIYGTYGNSTKKNDGTQTGGFGLGCKAPFAYTDHFEVTSCHAGTRTIYNLSKSSAQAMGKPGIIPIASFPSSDSGLTVSIRIKSSDHKRFLELITRIVCNGDMNMTLDGRQLDTVGFDMGKGNYLITKRTDLLDVGTRIMVRYGNVIYPIDSTKEVSPMYAKLVTHLDSLGTHKGEYSMVFQAPSHSISVTPSRESLSMQEHTVSTLNTLFSGFLDTLKKDFPTTCSIYADDIIAKAVTNKRLDELLKRHEALPDLHEKSDIFSISDLTGMAKAYMRNNYPTGLQYRKADITKRLDLMVKANLLDRGKVQTFLLALKDVKREHKYSDWKMQLEKSSWLQRRVVAPLLSKLGKEGLATDRLFVCDYEDNNHVRSSNNDTTSLVPAIRANPKHLLSTLPYLRNIIVLTSRRYELVNRAYQHDSFKNLGGYQGFLVYTVGRKTEDVEKAQRFFMKSGMRVIDLTPQDIEERVVHQRTTPRKPVKKGLVALSYVMDGTGIDTKRACYIDATRTLTPEFVINIPSRRDTTHLLRDWDRTSSTHLVYLFGDKGGITTTKATHEKYLKNGSRDFDTYVLEKICQYILFNPRIHEYWGFHPDLLSSEYNSGDSIIKLIYSNSVLKAEFKIVNNLTDLDKIYLHLWKQLSYQHPSSNNNPEVTKVRNWLNSIPLDIASTQLISKLTDNPLLDMLDMYTLREHITHSKNPSQVNKAIAFLIYVINQ